MRSSLKEYSKLFLDIGIGLNDLLIASLIFYINNYAQYA